MIFKKGVITTDSLIVGNLIGERVNTTIVENA